MIAPELLARLSSLAERTIADCTFPKTASYLGKEEEMPVLLPSGDEKYLSFWVRDFAMMAESGLLPDRELRRYIEAIALCGQNKEAPLSLAHGLTVPPYAIADHINYDGRPVFFPGTYRAGEDQGDGSYGFFPPFCDNYYFVLAAAQYIKQSGDLALLRAVYGGMPLIERLERAAEGYHIDGESGLCVSGECAYTVDWGFVDTVKKTGALLMASLLRRSAHLALATLFSQLGNEEKGKQYLAKAEKIADSVRKTFYDPSSGWLYSATGVGRQHDVWGTAYAVFSGAISEGATLEALARGYRDGTAVRHGYVRHIPLGEDHSATSMWEESRTELDRYQNGAFWATPTGWYAFALYLRDGSTDILSDFLAHTEAHAEGGAPFEWIDAETHHKSGLRYGTSGVLPYIGALRIAETSPRGW